MADVSLTLIPFTGYHLNNSFLNRLDPRVKLLTILLVFPPVLLVGKWFGLIPVALVAMACPLLARLSIEIVWRDLWSLRFFYLLTLIAHLIFDRTGKILLQLPYGFRLTATGLDRGLFFCAKIALMALLTGALLRTTHPIEWERALTRMIPRKGVLHRIFSKPVSLFGLSLRMLTLLLSEAERIRLAQIGRGLEFKGSLIARIRNLGPLIYPLISAALQKADSVAAAMHSRGFDLERARTQYEMNRMRVSDWAATIAILSVSILAFKFR